MRRRYRLLPVVADRYGTGKSRYAWVRVHDDQPEVMVRLVWERGRRKRIAFKPRGENVGYEWYGTVFMCEPPHGCLWSGRIRKAEGAATLLRNAGMIE